MKQLTEDVGQWGEPLEVVKEKPVVVEDKEAMRKRAAWDILVSVEDEIAQIEESMDYDKKIAALKQEMEEAKAKDSAEPKAEPKGEPNASAHEEKVFNELTDEVLERFVDGLLTVLGELELEGNVPEIENPEQARDSMLAVIRRLYMRKSLVARMSRKFARFGAKRFLRKQRTAIAKGLS